MLASTPDALIEMGIAANCWNAMAVVGLLMATPGTWKGGLGVTLSLEKLTPWLAQE